MSIFVWVWDWIKPKIKTLFEGWISPFTGWTSNRLKILGDSLTGLRGAWDNFTSRTLPALRTRIVGLEGSWSHFTSKTLPDLRLAISSGLKDLGDRITPLSTALENLRTVSIPGLWTGMSNLRRDVSAVIDKGLEDTRSWVSNTFGPTLKQAADLFRNPAFIALTRDPWEFVEIVFGRQIEEWASAAAESFWQGLEEGLRAEEET